MLQLVAKTMADSLREHDIPARYGGEEFVVLLPNAALDKAAEVAERIRENLAKRNIVKRQTGEALGSITMSIGVARYQFGESIVDFVNRADSALYAAKASGRNKVMVHAEGMDKAKTA